MHYKGKSENKGRGFFEYRTDSTPTMGWGVSTSTINYVYEDCHKKVILHCCDAEYPGGQPRYETSVSMSGTRVAWGMKYGNLNEDHEFHIRGDFVL